MSKNSVCFEKSLEVIKGSSFALMGLDVLISAPLFHSYKNYSQVYRALIITFNYAFCSMLISLSVSLCAMVTLILKINTKYSNHF